MVSAWVRCAGLIHPNIKCAQCTCCPRQSSLLVCPKAAPGHPRKVHPLTHVLAILCCGSHGDVPAAVGTQHCPAPASSWGRSLTKHLLMVEARWSICHADPVLGRHGLDARSHVSGLIAFGQRVVQEAAASPRKI